MVAEKIAGMDKELLRKLVGEAIADNPDQREIEAVIAKKLMNPECIDFDEMRS
jgi:hypothetical protein